MSAPGPLLRLRLDELDVFTDRPLRGNPLAVVHGADGLDEATMADFARWTQFSETTFLLVPTDPEADYRVRIFTPGGELPFAGHPTLGTCHAWLAAGGQPRQADRVVQECGVGRVTVRRGTGGRLAFEAPPLRREGPLEAAMVARIAAALRLAPAEILAHAWVDNGPGWCAVQLESAARVLALRPDMAALGELRLGVVGAHPPGAEAQLEVRAFIPGLSVPEDPVTGSLNAGLAQWLIASGRAPARYMAAQGTALGRAGRVHLQREDDGRVWVGGDVVEVVSGWVRLNGAAGVNG